MFQMKEHDKKKKSWKNSQEIVLSKWSDKELNEIIMKVFTEHRKRTKEPSDNFKKELENIRTNQIWRIQ